MDKSIVKHREYITSKIKALEKSEDKKVDIQSLYRFHVDRVKDFQHERLVHLLVTLFFASLLIDAVVGFATTMFITQSTYELSMISILLGILICILLATNLFYVRHYYQLENGTQSLYKLTDKLNSLINS